VDYNSVADITGLSSFV